MRRVSASALVPGRVAEAEALWYDLARWPAFVDGFGAVVAGDPEWPAAGAKLVWRSTPHGRGEVHERVTAHAAGTGQTVEFHDEKLAGEQTVAFAPQGEATRVTLTMEYRIQEPTPLTPLVDLLFVRRAVGDALRRTVARFAREREGDIRLS